MEVENLRHPNISNQIEQHHDSSKLVKHATLKVYPGGSQSLADTHKDQLNADLLAFLKI